MQECGPVSLVLLDEDDEAAQVVRRAAEAAQHACVVFKTLDACLRFCDEPRIGCLMLCLDVNGAANLLETPGVKSCHLTPVAIARSADGKLIARAMKLGAIEFLSKPLHETSVMHVVAQAVRLGLRRALDAAERQAAIRRLNRLTPAERQVFDAIVKGHTMNRIAVETARSVKTIYTHSRRIMDKTGAESVAALIQLAGRARDPAEGDM